MEGIVGGLIGVLSRRLSGMTEENYENPQAEYPVSLPK
jgi:hypothetical protein